MSAHYDRVVQSYLSPEQQDALRQAELANQATAVIAMGDILSTLRIDGVAADAVMIEFSRHVSRLDRTASREVASNIERLRAALGTTAVESCPEIVTADTVLPELKPQEPLSILNELPSTNGHTADSGFAEHLVDEAPIETESSITNDVTESSLPMPTSNPETDDTHTTSVDLEPEDHIATDAQAVDADDLVEPTTETETDGSEKLLCAVGIDTLCDLCGEDMRQVFESFTESQAEDFISELVSLVNERFSLRKNNKSQLETRTNFITARVLEGSHWSAISKSYRLSDGTAYANYNLFKKLIERISDEERVRLFTDLMANTAEQTVAEPTPQAPAETPTAETKETLEPAPVFDEKMPATSDETGEKNFDAATKEPDENAYDQLCRLFGYTTRDQRKTLARIFSMDITGPVHTPEAKEIYADLVAILDLTVKSKLHLWPHTVNEDLELLALNTVLRGAQDGKSPLAPISARGKLNKELAAAKRKFEEVLDSAIKNFAAAREEILGR